jgi:hypothetical protein
MFDRNNFKGFVISQEKLIKENCSVNHPTVQYHEIYKDIIWSKSFRSIQNEEFAKLKLIGNLKDPKIKMLHSVGFSNSAAEFWSENYKIATNFYPYHSSDIYQCEECKRLFVAYTETGGHFPQFRIREVKKELIIEEPGSCILKLTKTDLSILANFLKFTMEKFTTLLNENRKTERIKTDFDVEDVLVSELYDDYYLIVGKKMLIYDIVNLFEK